MTRNEELIKLRVLKLIPEASWITASRLSSAYESKYHEALSKQKITRILKEMHDDALIRMAKKRRSWGFIAQYSTQEEPSKNPTLEK